MRRANILSMLLCSALLTGGVMSIGADEIKPAKSGGEVKSVKYVRKDVGAYVLEVPEGWSVGEETPWGQREIMSAEAIAKLKEKSAALAGKGDAAQDTPTTRMQNYLAQMKAVAKFNSMSTMTAPGAHNEPWEQLYNTSLFFIMQQYKKGEVKAMPFKVTKAPQGYEACSWTVEEKDGGIRARHVVLRNSAGKILALSIKFATTKGNEADDAAFEHMVTTASLK